MPYRHHPHAGTLSRFPSLTLVLTLCATLCSASVAHAATNPTALMGYTAGAQTLTVNVENGQIDEMSGVVYQQIKEVRRFDQLKMTLLIPRTKTAKPAVVYFPGGGFTSADHEKFIEMRYALARAGFVVAAAEYRPVPTRFPGLVEDGKAAVRFLRSHAMELGIDPDKIGVLGDSAGGYLAEMLGTTNGETGWDKGEWLTVNSDVQAVVSLYGLSDLRSVGEGFSEATNAIHAANNVTEALLLHGPAFAEYPGGTIHTDEAKTLHASAIGHVDGSEPPILLMHGSADKLVSPWQSAHLFEALSAKHVKGCEYVLVEGAGHGDLPWYQPPVIDRVVSYFVTHLGDPAKAPKLVTPTAKGGNL